MRFALFAYENKGAYLRQRLEARGHTVSERIEETDLLILDCDWWWAAPRPAMIDVAEKHGVKVALYPHGGQSTTFVYDGLTKPDRRVALRLEHGPGSIEIARLFGGDTLNQHAAGWLFSPTAPFSPLDDPGRILFAPMHPNIEALNKRQNGHDPGPRINQRIYRELLETGREFTVSLVGPPDRNGIWAHPRATLVQNNTMALSESFQLLETVDSVIATGTLAALAVARGKPTVMFAQHDLTDYVDGRYQEAEHADLYRGIVRYPINCDDGHVSDLLARACAGDTRAAEWREAFVGKDGTEAAIRLLENLAGEPLPEQAKSDVTIQGATAVLNMSS